MSKLNKIFVLSILIFSGLIYTQYNLIRYGVSQLNGQLNILWNSRPIDEVLSDSKIHDTIKQKLILIQEIKAFAVDSLGIKKSKNYTTYFDQQNKPLLYVLTGAAEFEMKNYEWSFPFLGRVSYKGFFKEEAGMLEEKELIKNGYDTDLGTVGAWSTLGWFNDPILSGMLKRNEGNLANLIIHELTHGTLYVKDNVEFNENLASFIGEKGAIEFLKHKYGEESLELKIYRENKSDDEIFSNYILKGANQLDSLYKTFNNSSPVDMKRKEKLLLINKIIDGVNQLNLFNKKKYLFIVSFAKTEKNAFFMSYMRYKSEQSLLEKEFKKYGNLKDYLKALKQKYNSV